MREKYVGLVGRETKEEEISKNAEKWEMKESKSPWVSNPATQSTMGSEGKRYTEEWKVNISEVKCSWREMG